MSLDRPKIIPFSQQFLIQADPGFYDPHSYFLNAAQQIIDGIIPESFWMERDPNAEAETVLYQLNAMLPIFKHSELDETSKSLSLTYLYPAEYTHYARRYVVETLNKWLNPGKQVEIAGGFSLAFQFVQAPSQRFFVAQDVVSIRTQEENLAIQKNLPELIEQLKKKLPHEFLRQTENTFHPLFMPRNEEDTIRNLIVLSNQIKYVRDLPQVSIHYEKQTDIDLTFTIIIARLLKARNAPLRKILEKSPLKMDIDDLRIMGFLKQKYLKEGAVLRITLNKGPFFRADYSVDLLRARQKIVAGLAETLGKFRDFNGGIILRQEESLRLLREELGALSPQKEFLLENYFYSLKPAIMQTIYEPSLLKKHFELLNTALETDFKTQSYKIVSITVDKFLLCFVAAGSRGFKEKILEAIAPLEISSRNLTLSFQQLEEGSVMGFILRMETSEIGEKFQTAIEQSCLEWSRHFYCIVS